MRSTGQDPQKVHSIWQRLHIDVPLLLGILALLALGLFLVYSAGGQKMDIVIRQAIHSGIALVVMLGIAQIQPLVYQKLAVPMFVIGILMLIAVLMFGHVGKGAEV